MYWLIMVSGEPFEMYEDYDEAYQTFDDYCDSHPFEKVELLECCVAISYGGVEVL